MSSESLHWLKNSLTASSLWVYILSLNADTPFQHYGIYILGFVFAFLAISDKTDSAAGLQVAHFSLRDIQNPARFFQRKPVAGILVADFLKEIEYNFMKVGHSLEHCVKHLLVDCYEFDSKLDLVGLRIRGVYKGCKKAAGIPPAASPLNPQSKIKFMTAIQWQS